MKISFLVTYYNQVNFVKQSLESILALDIPYEYEILVGDDGSTDGTVDEVKKYIKINPYIKVFIMDRDGNTKYDPILRASKNRLNLLEHATGDYYCILDGDDWYTSKTFVKEAINIMDMNDNVPVCAFNFAWVSTDDIKIQPISLNCGRISSKEYIETTYTHAAACVFRNVLDEKKLQLIKQTGYFDDESITITHLDYGDMYYIPKVVLAYRQTGVGVWTGMTKYEKHVLAASQYDIIVKCSYNYSQEIRKRLFYSLKYIWKTRACFYTELGNEKAGMYIAEAERIGGVLSRIVNFDKLNKKEQYDIKFFMKDTFLFQLIGSIKCVTLFIKKVFKALLPYGIIKLFNKNKRLCI